MSIFFTNQYVLVDSNNFDSRKRLVKMVRNDPVTGLPEYVSNLVRDVKPVNNISCTLWSYRINSQVYLESMVSMSYVAHESGALTIKQIGSRPTNTASYALINAGLARTNTPTEITNWDIGE